MLPLIKWPGGKTSELPVIKQYLPESYASYVEPFFGGGALYFDLLPEKATINDVSKNLMTLYRFIGEGNTRFCKCMYGIADEWDLVKQYCGDKAEFFSVLFRSYTEGETDEEELLLKAEHYVDAAVEFIAGRSKVISDAEAFRRELKRTVSDKLLRTARNELKFGKLSEEDLQKNVLTGFTSGYYMYMRHMLNAMEKDKYLYISDEYRIAVFFFVREFCYGSMFRYNKNGDFNVPYGGIGYNGKDFRKKVDALFHKNTIKALSSAKISCCDFEAVIKGCGKEDFIFLDPPYDTDFSEYETNVFGKAEHERLGKCLKETQAKFLLVIKNTPFISRLYEDNGFEISAFDNKYSYCVKGRNDRDAEHLIITNYPIMREKGHFYENYQQTCF